MRRLRPLYGFLLPGLILAAAACASLSTQDQMRFGIEAANNDLWDEAIFRWKKVLQTEPNSASAHNNLAVAYEKKGLWEEAEKEYLKAIELSPQDEHIQSNYTKFKKNQEPGGEELEPPDEKRKGERR